MVDGAYYTGAQPTGHQLLLDLAVLFPGCPVLRGECRMTRESRANPPNFNSSELPDLNALPDEQPLETI